MNSELGQFGIVTVIMSCEKLSTPRDSVTLRTKYKQ